MIVVHEGLPRSGKSYEAVVARIIPALSAGRVVDARIDGLDFDRLASAAGITAERCRELLRVIEAAQMDRVWEHTRDNALVVLDEAQNFWPSRGFQPSRELISWIAEHGHRGQDVVLLTQDLRDVHPIWRRRVESKFVFLKLSAVGRENSYSVTAFQQLPGDKWEQTTANFGKYDPKFFGCYASHTGSNIQTGNYKDRRSLVWSNPLLKLGLPAVLVLAVVAFSFVRSFFAGDHIKAGAPAVSAAASAPGVSAPVPVVSNLQRPAPFVPRVGDPVDARIAALDSDGARWRLAGYVQAAGVLAGWVEVWDTGGSRVLERLTFDQLRLAGFALVMSDATLTIRRGQWSTWATMWPVESSSRLSDDRELALRQAGGVTVEPAPAGQVRARAGEALAPPVAQVAGIHYEPASRTVESMTRRRE